MLQEPKSQQQTLQVSFALDDDNNGEFSKEENLTLENVNSKNLTMIQRGVSING